MSADNAAAPAIDRAVKAAAIVLALLVSVPGVEVLTRMVGDSGRPAMAESMLDSRSLIDAGDPFGALDRIEGAADASGEEVPEIFDREVGFLPGARDVRVDGTGSVVGYSVAGQVDDVLDDLVARMDSLGWTVVSLGGVEGATFAKTGGGCTWALATCTQVGDSTSVVMRCMYT